MPKITIDGHECEFKPGQMILQVANDHALEIPQYCYHDALSIVASCRICLVEVWAPNPRNDNKLEPIPKLLPACQTPAGDNQVVYSDSPRSVANQKAVMEYLLITHPLDCPVCDQSGECDLQDYSYKYGRGVSRFEESKVKQPKKDLGPNVLLYADRCIMCSRCVRFTREISGTGELMVAGRGNTEQIDVFPGRALDNEVASNVIDLCPVGALLDKDFLFKKRVWDLTVTPSIDGITSSGDNITLEHADNRIHRVKPRENMAVNKWWITDEVRYGWKFIHSRERLTTPMRRQYAAQVACEFARAYEDAIEGVQKAVQQGKRLALVVSPMLSCEDAFHLARLARALDEKAMLAVGPIPVRGEDKIFPPGAAEDDPRRFTMRAEKCPNARGVRRALEAVAAGDTVWSFEDITAKLNGAQVGALLLTGGVPSDRATPALKQAFAKNDLFTILIDVLNGPLVAAADIVLPGSTWAEKEGTFENATNRLQGFARAINPVEHSRPEAQIAIDMLTRLEQGDEATPPRYSAEQTRQRMADAGLTAFTSEVHLPPGREKVIADLQVVEL
ncbi:MAG: molybdopterin-dependent oxidoreductase [Planctomycetota bacterium]|nr:molybdopterin-dependent oxidoreductase [Planctomycetota bacterium]